MINTVQTGPNELSVFKDGVFRGYVFKRGKRYGTDGYRNGRCIDAYFSTQERAIEAVAD